MKPTVAQLHFHYESLINLLRKVSQCECDLADEAPHGICPECAINGGDLVQAVQAAIQDAHMAILKKI